MKISTEHLLTVLKIVKPGLAKREIIDKSTHFIFSGSDVLTYNDRICISYPLKTDFECSVPAAEFFKIVSNMEENEIDIVLKDDKLFLKGTKARSCYTTFSQENIAAIKKLISALNLKSLKNKWKPLPKDFVDGLKLTMFSASQDLSFGALNNVSVQNNVLISSDNNRVSYYQMKSSTDKEFLIPLSSVVELVNFPVDRFVLSESWVYFSTSEGVVFASRVVNEKFPNVKSLLSSIKEGEEFTFPDGAKKLVDDVSILAPGEYDLDRIITVKMARGKLVCKGEKATGWIEKEIAADYKGSPLQFFVNPIFLSQILSKSTSILLGQNRALFQSGKFRHLMSLPRFDEGEEE